MRRFHKILDKLDEAIINSGMSEKEIGKLMGLRRFNRLSKVVMYSVEKLSKICVILNLDANEILCITEKEGEKSQTDKDVSKLV